MDRVTRGEICACADDSQGSTPAGTVLPRIDVRTVLQGAREVILLHGAQEYRLKLTAAGKLILTK